MFYMCFIAYIQTTRALMITGSVLGLPAVGMILMSMPCISLGNEPQNSKNKRTILGGVLILIVGKRLNFIFIRAMQPEGIRGQSVTLMVTQNDIQ